MGTRYGENYELLAHSNNRGMNRNVIVVEDIDTKQQEARRHRPVQNNNSDSNVVRELMDCVELLANKVKSLENKQKSRVPQIVINRPLRLAKEFKMTDLMNCNSSESIVRAISITVGELRLGCCFATSPEPVKPVLGTDFLRLYKVLCNFQQGFVMIKGNRFLLYQVPSSSMNIGACVNGKQQNAIEEQRPDVVVDDNVTADGEEIVLEMNVKRFNAVARANTSEEVDPLRVKDLATTVQDANATGGDSVKPVRPGQGYIDERQREETGSCEAMIVMKANLL